MKTRTTVIALWVSIAAPIASTQALADALSPDNN